MEWESDSPCHSHMYPGQGHRPPRRHSGWELVHRIVEQSQGEGCCWLQRDGPRGCEGGDCGGKYLWRKDRQPWKQGDTAESCVVGGAIAIASLSLHASIGSWTHQAPDTLNYRVSIGLQRLRHDWRDIACTHALSTKIPMLCIRSLDLIHSITEILLPFTNLSHFHLPALSNHNSILFP